MERDRMGRLHGWRCFFFALAGLELRIWIGIGLGFHGLFTQRYRAASTSANGLNTRLILLCPIGRKPSHQIPASGTAIPIRTVFQADID
jgi:hypothetical protein